MVIRQVVQVERLGTRMLTSPTSDFCQSMDVPYNNLQAEISFRTIKPTMETT